MNCLKNSVLIFLISGSVGVVNAQSGATALQCPQDKTADSIDDFRKNAIGQAVMGNYGAVHESMGNCFGTELPGCLSDLKDYVNYGRARGAAGGSTYSGDEPAEGLILKSEKDLPVEFQAKDSSGSPKPGFIRFPPDILKVAKDKGWKAIGYKTRSTGGFDVGPNLTLVAIPGADRDTYLQISPPSKSNFHRSVNEVYPDNNNLSEGQNVLTVISVDKTMRPPVAQLQRMQWDPSANAYRYTARTSAESGDCIRCHASPLRSISPRGYLTTNGDEKRLKPEDEKTITEINDMMIVEGLTWGKRKVGDALVSRGPDPASHPLGWSPVGSNTRTLDFINSCAKSSTSIDYVSITDDYRVSKKMSNEPQNLDPHKVLAVMSCSQCHSNTVRGSLHEDFSPAEVKFKILVDRSMPPGAKLTDDERIALVNCLYAERQVVRNDWAKGGEWLKKQECEGSESRRRRTRNSAPSSTPGVQ